MKTTMFRFLQLIAISVFLSACGGSDDNMGFISPSHTTGSSHSHDGLYEVATVVVAGPQECVDQTVQFRIYKSVLYLMPRAIEDLHMDGFVLASTFSGSLYGESIDPVFFDGRLTQDKAFGDFESMDGECFGFFTGGRVDKKQLEE